MAELERDAQDARIRNDVIIDGLVGKLREAQSKDKQLQGPSQSYLPSHEEMGEHQHHASTAGRRPSFPVMPGGTQEPPALSPYTSQSTHTGAIDSPQLPQLTPERAATSATSQGPLDPEEAIESDSQAGSGSGKQ